MAALTDYSYETSLRMASDALLPVGCEATPLRLGCADTLVFHRIDRVEDARRRAAGAEPLDAFRPLEMLTTLPVGIPVPRATLAPALRSEVRFLPRGAAVYDHQTVTRLAVRPLRVELVVVWAPGWRSGMDLASQFAPFSRRAMALERVPDQFDDALLEADFYGIGVYARRGDSVEVAVQPAEYRPLRNTTAAWRFAEEIYRRIVEFEG